MIGYHYTTYSNWKRIKKEGLIPYKIQREELLPYFKRGIAHGIWVWTKKLKSIAHVGAILYQMTMKNELKAVLLKVKFNYDDVLSPPNSSDDIIALCHHGTIGNLKYHRYREEAYIITKPIKDFKLLKVYNFKKAFKT